MYRLKYKDEAENNANAGNNYRKRKIHLIIGIFMGILCVGILSGFFFSYIRTGNSKREMKMIFEKLPESFSYASGENRWTTIRVRQDGTFTGETYEDRKKERSMEFSGTFSGLKKVNAHIYTMQLGSFSKEIKSNEENYSVQGLDAAETLTLYLPGTKVDEIPPEIITGSVLESSEYETLPEGFYICYSEEEETVFWGDTEAYLECSKNDGSSKQTASNEKSIEEPEMEESTDENISSEEMVEEADLPLYKDVTPGVVLKKIDGIYHYTGEIETTNEIIEEKDYYVDDRTNIIIETGDDMGFPAEGKTAAEWLDDFYSRKKFWMIVSIDVRGDHIENIRGIYSID